MSSGDALELSSALRTGVSFSVQEATDSVLNSMVVSTDIPDLETLYRLDILATGTRASTGTAADTAVQVRFAANPLLGISDAPSHRQCSTASRSITPLSSSSSPQM
jgi:hypothetical protein